MMRWLRPAAVALAGFVLLVGSWQGLILLLDLKPYILPTPLATLQGLQAERTALAANLGFTLRTALLGITCSLVAAVATAALFTILPRLSDAILPYAIVIKSTPVVAVAPLVTLMAGRGLVAGILIVSIVSFFPMLVTALQGFTAARRAHLELMHLYAASPLQTFLKVRLPFAVPYLFTGLRTAAPVAMLGAILSEWLTGAAGIGHLILEYASLREIEALWAGILVCMVFGLAIFWLTALAERRFAPKAGVPD